MLLCIFLFNTGFKTMLNLAIEHNSLKGIFSIFFLLLPILFLLFTIISVAYIRKDGQFAAVTKVNRRSHPFLDTGDMTLSLPSKISETSLLHYSTKMQWAEES